MKTTLDYSIRPGRPADVPQLAAIEREASTLFLDRLADAGLTKATLAEVTSLAVLEEAARSGRLWVAASLDGVLVGFALVLEVGGYAHIDELSVSPTHSRRGVGSAILSAVCSWGAKAGCRGVTLSTFRDAPWNAPFYRRRGFRSVEPSELSAEHVRLALTEEQRGLRAELRTMMLFILTE